MIGRQSGRAEPVKVAGGGSPVAVPNGPPPRWWQGRQGVRRTGNDGIGALMDKQGASGPGAFEKVRFLGLAFDQLGTKPALVWLLERAADAPYFYVTTPNVDHIVRLHTEAHSDDVRAAYADSDLTLCDSKVLALLARCYGVHLHVGPGSDITADLFAVLAGSDAPVVIIGGDDHTLPRLREAYGLTRMVQHVPPMGLIRNRAALDAAAQFIVDNPARFIFIAVGSPQQEVIAWRARQMGATQGIALCIGASIDYLTGRSHRAPMLFRVLALEWLYRLIREPRRLWRRYLVRSPRIFSLVERDARRRRKARKVRP